MYEYIHTGALDKTIAAKLGVTKAEVRDTMARYSVSRYAGYGAKFDKNDKPATKKNLTAYVKARKERTWIGNFDDYCKKYGLSDNRKDKNNKDKGYNGDTPTMDFFRVLIVLLFLYLFLNQ